MIVLYEILTHWRRPAGNAGDFIICIMATRTAAARGYGVEFRRRGVAWRGRHPHLAVGAARAGGAVAVLLRIVVRLRRVLGEPVRVALYGDTRPRARLSGQGRSGGRSRALSDRPVWRKEECPG